MSDFAKSLASTLDSEINHLTISNSDPTSGTETPTEEKSDFNTTPATPIAVRQVATAPATPTGRATPRRGIQFSPRLEVHETWHSTEYDRRGEPATCNRLTAQLAQMIKEELNAFKMEEMIVHEVRFYETRWIDNSRKVDLIHTSFNSCICYDLLIGVCIVICMDKH